MTARAVLEIVQQYFPQGLKPSFQIMTPKQLGQIQEIRCRVLQPVELCLDGRQRMLLEEVLQPQELTYMVMRMNQSSVYAWEEEYRRGYLTLPGGHRVGMVGKGVLEKGHIRTLKQISSLNFRIAKEIYGAADPLLPELIEHGQVVNTLLVSPPGCGKTTMLRDAIRQLSQGIPQLAFEGIHVAVVDERSELAGTVNGQPQLQIGCRTDVLDGCPKSEGMRMLIRSMAPDLLVSDEIGTAEDVMALEEALQAGIAVFITAHGGSIQDLMRHPHLSRLLTVGFFRKIVFLARSQRIGQIQAVYHWEHDQYQERLYHLAP